MENDDDSTAILRDALTNFANAMMRKGFSEPVRIPVEGSTTLDWTGKTILYKWGGGAHCTVESMSTSELVAVSTRLDELYTAAEQAKKQRNDPIRQATERVRATATRLGLTL